MLINYFRDTILTAQFFVPSIVPITKSNVFAAKSQVITAS